LDDLKEALDKSLMDLVDCIDGDSCVNEIEIYFKIFIKVYYAYMEGKKKG